jgi:hypothetical protein
MLICKLPDGIRKVSDQYKSLWAALDIGFANTTALFVYFLFGCSSLSQLARMHVQSPSVSELSNAVKNFPGTRFMRRCRSSILRKYGDSLNPDDFVIAIDDTDNPRYGKKIYGCGNWVAKHSSYHGQKILLLALVDIRRRIAIPLSYSFLLNKEHPDHKNSLDMALELVDQCLVEGFPKLPVVADSWFDSAPLMQEFMDRGIVYVSEIKSKRVARNSTGQWVRYRKLPSIFSSPYGEVLARPLATTRGRGRPNLRFTECKVLQLKNLKTPVMIVAVYNRRKSTKAFAYYCSTDRTMPGATVWKIFRSRWCIEVLFRDLKQNLSFGKLPCTGKNASDLAVCLPLILIVSLRLRPELWGQAENRTIGVMIRDIKSRTLSSSIEALSLEGAGKLRSRVLARRDGSRLVKKPTNQAAA